MSMENEHKKTWGTVFADMSKGQAVTESGVKFTFAPGCSLLTLLKTAVQHTPVNRVYLVGKLLAGYQEWLISPEMYKYWRTQQIGHMLDGSRTDDYVARYEHRVSGQKLDIRSVVHWLGEGEYTVFQARSAMLLTTQYLKGAFPLFQHLSGTPSTTFSVLWRQYNGMEKKSFPVLAERTRAAIHDSTGQGRIEYFPANAKGRIPGLYYYDGIFTYAALCRELPTEIESHDNLQVFAGKQTARYKLVFRVPAEWKHIGPFGVRIDDVWEYPGYEKAGQYYETWVDGAELDALVSCYTPTDEPDKKEAYRKATFAAFNHWQIIIKERIVYKNGRDCQNKNPLDGVIKKLAKLRDKAEEDGKQDVAHATAYKLARAAIRNIVIHGIGAFNRVAGTRTYIGLITEPRPSGYITRTELADGRVAYIVPEAAETGALSHPEWPACVWGRCRARMFKNAMSQPYERIITIQTDAIALTHPVPEWESNTEIGKLRRKWAETKPLKGPANLQQFNELQRKRK